MPTFAAPGPITATVEVAGARVRVTASDRSDTVVLVEPRNTASLASPDSPDASDAQLTLHSRTRYGDVIIGRAAR